MNREEELVAKAKEYAAHMNRLDELETQRRALETQCMNGHNERTKLEVQLYDFVGANIPRRYVVVGGKVVVITHGPDDGRVRIDECISA